LCCGYGLTGSKQMIGGDFIMLEREEGRRIMSLPFD